MTNKNEIKSFLFCKENILSSDFSKIIKEDFNAEIVDDEGRTPLMFFLQVLIDDMDDFRYGKERLIDHYGVEQIVKQLSFLLSKSKDNLGQHDLEGRSVLSYVLKLRLGLTKNFVELVYGIRMYPRDPNIINLYKALDSLKSKVSSYKTTKDIEVLLDLLNKIRSKDIEKSGMLELIEAINQKNEKDIFSGKDSVAKYYEETYSHLSDCPSLKEHAEKHLKVTLLHENFEKINLFWKKMKLDKNSWKNNLDKVYSDELSKLNSDSNMLDVSKFGVSIFTAALITVSVVLADFHLKGLLLGLAISSVVLLPVAIFATSIFLYKFYQLVIQDSDRIAKVQEISNKVNSADLNENMSYEQYEANNGSINSDEKYQDTSLKVVK